MQSLDFLLPNEHFAQNLAERILPTLAPLCTELSFTGEDDAPLYGRMYHTPHARAVVVISHGYCEYADKYLEVIYNLVQLGYAVAICEHRGHGFSARMIDHPHKVHITSFDTYIRDFDAFSQCVQEAFPTLPRVLLGHSMGGCIAARTLEVYPTHYCAAILSCPMLEIHPAHLPMWGASLYCKLNFLRGKGEDVQGKSADFDTTSDFENSNSLCRERFDAFFAQRLAEPKYQTAHGTVAWLDANLKGIRVTVCDAANVTVPVLLCQAGKDSLVYPNGHAKFLARAKQGQLLHFAQAKHELFTSTTEIRLQLWQAIADFLEAHTPNEA